MGLGNVRAYLVAGIVWRPVWVCVCGSGVGCAVVVDDDFGTVSALEAGSEFICCARIMDPELVVLIDLVILVWSL